MASLKNARALLRHYASELMAYPNVVAVAIGRKETAGEVNDRGWVIRVHVSRKTSQRTARSVPRELPAPKGRPQLGSIETDVIQTGKTRLDAGVRSGASLQVADSGTLGCILSANNDRYYILTAGHVLDGRLVADSERNGVLELGSLPDASIDGIGVVGIPVRCSRKTKYIDLGLILLLRSIKLASQFATGLRDVRSNAEPLKTGDRIIIVRRNGFLRVDYHQGADRDGHVAFDYPRPTGQGTITVTFKDVVFYPKTGNGGTLQGGDSGSAVLDGDGRLIGIHIGSSYGELAEGNTMLLGYAIPTAEIRSWASGMSLVCKSGEAAL